jgi:hypothetical protein
VAVGITDRFGHAALSPEEAHGLFTKLFPKVARATLRPYSFVLFPLFTAALQPSATASTSFLVQQAPRYLQYCITVRRPSAPGADAEHNEPPAQLALERIGQRLTARCQRNLAESPHGFQFVSADLV